MQSQTSKPALLRWLCLPLLMLFLFTFSGCDLAVGIFKAGFWTAIIVIVIVVVIVGWLIMKMRK